MGDSLIGGVTPVSTDKAFWVSLLVTLLTPVMSFVAQKWGITLDPTVLAGIIVVNISYILSHKWKSKALAELQIKTDVAKVQADKIVEQITGK